MVLLIFLLFGLATAYTDPVLTFEDYFYNGKVAYTDREWSDCVGFMRRAVDDFRYYEDESYDCRKKCSERIPMGDESELLSSWHRHSQRALCIMKCKADRFGGKCGHALFSKYFRAESRSGIKKMSTVFDLMERRPYQYMHICYWNNKDLANAVKSAYTFLVANPEDQDAIGSLNFYMNQDGFEDEMLIDSEIHDHEIKYLAGVRAYNEEEWSQCVHNFEAAIDKALSLDDRCRWLCEDKIDWGSVINNPEFDVVFTSMRHSVVRCQHDCLYKAGLINGHHVGELFASIFDYLHYCQFKLMRASEAMQSVANYLLFDDNPLMRRNRHFYSKLYQKDDLFKPEEKIAKVHKQRIIEKRYLDFIETRIVTKDGQFPTDQADDRNKLDLDVDTTDNFPYEQIVRLISEEECKKLRAPFEEKSINLLEEEIERRVKTIWASAKFAERKCAPSVVEAPCERPIVLSIEHKDCSDWLGKWYNGCALIFCDKKSF